MESENLPRILYFPILCFVIFPFLHLQVYGWQRYLINRKSTTRESEGRRGRERKEWLSSNIGEPRKEKDESM